MLTDTRTEWYCRRECEDQTEGGRVRCYMIDECRQSQRYRCLKDKESKLRSAVKLGQLKVRGLKVEAV